LLILLVTARHLGTAFVVLVHSIVKQTANVVYKIHEEALIKMAFISRYSSVYPSIRRKDVQSGQKREKCEP